MTHILIITAIHGTDIILPGREVWRRTMTRSILILCTVFALQANCETPVENTARAVNSNSASVKILPATDKRADQEKVNVSDEKELLAKRFERDDPDTAALIMAADSTVERIATPFLNNGRIYKISKFAPSRAIIVYVGLDPKDFQVKLNANEDGYFELAERAGLNITKNENRISYVTTFLETVESKNKRLRVIESVDDIERRPNLDQQKQEEFEAFREKYGKVIKAPETKGDAVELFAVKGQDLVKATATISVAGKIALQETVLEQDLLIPYAM